MQKEEGRMQKGEWLDERHQGVANDPRRGRANGAKLFSRLTLIAYRIFYRAGREFA